MLAAIALPAALVILMFGLGMTLTRGDFARVAQYRTAIAGALASIFIAMPLAAVAIARWLNLDTSLSLGLVLLAACPGGMFSNLVTHTMRGDVALSVTLTVCSSVLYALGMPLASALLHHANVAGEGLLPGPALKMFGEVLGVVIVPLAAGMSLRRVRPVLCGRIEKPLRLTAAVLVAGVFGWLGYTQFALFRTSGVQVVAAVALLNLSGWTMAALLAWKFRLTREAFCAVGVEHSIRQEGVGVFFAVSILGDSAAAAPLIVNSLVGFVVAVTLNMLVARVTNVTGKGVKAGGQEQIAADPVGLTPTRARRKSTCVLWSRESAQRPDAAGSPAH